MESINLYDQLVSSDWLEQDAFLKAFPEDALHTFPDGVTSDLKPLEGNAIPDIPADPLDTGLDVFEQSWLDQKVNLFDFLGCDDLDIGLSSQLATVSDDGSSLTPSPEPAPVSNQEESAMQILQSLVQETEIVPNDPEATEFSLDTVDFSQLMQISLDSSASLDSTLNSPDTSLSYISADDIESILSSGPSSPEASPGTSDSDWSPKERSTPYSRSPKSKTTSPKTKITDRKLRKKEQNKTAALRYRLKKRAEQDQFLDETTELEKRNQELKDKVEQMTREIGYLKDLMQEVYKVKGLAKA